jgi:SynChlorMet cassette radical SAM/SPASM protein ScmE
MSDMPTEIKVMPSPRHVDIAVTGCCNLACQYCFYAEEMAARSDLPTETWLAFFEELSRLGVMTVTLTGGEAFTRPDLFELIDGVIANRMRYNLLSNGTLITEKTLAQFTIGKRRQRLDSIQISIDGSSAEVHDRSRPKSFRRALRGLKLLHDADFPVTVRVTINRYNVDDLENVAHLLLEEVGILSFGTNEAYPCGAVDRSGEIALTPGKRSQAMRVLTELSERYPGRISATAGPLAYARELKRIEEAMRRSETSFPGRGHLTACGGVFSKMAVMHDGTLVPCHNLSTLHMGQVGQDDLAQVWQTHPMMQAVRQRYTIPLSKLETCQDCTFQGFCTGGCPGGAVYLLGDLNARNPLDCYRIHLSKDPALRFDPLEGSLPVNRRVDS